MTTKLPLGIDRGYRVILRVVVDVREMAGHGQSAHEARGDTVEPPPLR